MTNSMQDSIQPIPQVVVVGSGYWGQNLVRNYYQMNALLAICDSNRERLEELGKKYPEAALISDYQEVLDDEKIRAVVIATPAETHFKLVKLALEAGKDVYVEKPLCLSVEEGTELVALARKLGRILMVGHLLWYHPALRKLKEMIDEGELGQIRYIYSHRLNFGKIRREENILWSFAPHDISVILGLLGEMPDSVQAQGGNYLHSQIADVTMSTMSFPSGVKAHIFVSWLHPFKEQKLVVVGDKKMAVFNDVEKTDKLLLYPHSIDWKNNLPIANKAESQAVIYDETEPLRAECLHFLECIQTRTQPLTDGSEGLRVLTVLNQCQDALNQPGTAVAAQPVPAAEVVPQSQTETVKYKAHPSAFIDEGAEIGAGTAIWHVSHIMKNTKIGENCKIGQNVVVGPNVTVGNGVKIQNNVSVYDGVILEDNVFCGPSMVFTNVFNPRSEVSRMDELRSTLVKTGATLGANCTIVCGNTVGRYAFVAAGAVVAKDVPDYALVMGSPARVKGWMCECGVKLEFAGSAAGSCTCGSCGRSYEKTGEQVRRIEQEAIVVKN